MAAKRVTDKQLIAESNRLQCIINKFLTDEDAKKLEREMAERRARLLAAKQMHGGNSGAASRRGDEIDYQGSDIAQEAASQNPVPAVRSDNRSGPEGGRDNVGERHTREPPQSGTAPQAVVVGVTAGRDRQPTSAPDAPERPLAGTVFGEPEPARTASPDPRVHILNLALEANADAHERVGRLESKLAALIAALNLDLQSIDPFLGTPFGRIAAHERLRAALDEAREDG